jgi:electron transfer flavoprotein alpha subunit
MNASAQVTKPAHVVAVVPVRAGELCAGGAEALAEALSAGGSGILVIQHETDLSPELRHHLNDRVQIVQCGDFAPARWSRQLSPLVGGSQVVLLPASPDGRDLAPRLAAHLQRPLLAGALHVTAEQILVPRTFGTELHRFGVDAPMVATLQVGVRGVDEVEVVTAVGSDPTPPLAVTLTEAAGSRDAIVEKVQEPDVATMDLAEAPRIMGGGAGLREAEDFDRLSTVAAQLGAAMGATRVITDRGWIHHDRQIGTTGVIVDPDLYVAWGISGAVQHTAGLGHPTHIISVNTDPHCPMMQLADLAIVSDASEVLHCVAERLKTDV